MTAGSAIFLFPDGMLFVFVVYLRDQITQQAQAHLESLHLAL